MAHVPIKKKMTQLNVIYKKLTSNLTIKVKG